MFFNLLTVHRADGDSAEHVICQRGIRESRGKAEEARSRLEELCARFQRSQKGDGHCDNVAEGHEEDGSLLEQFRGAERFCENAA